MEISSGTWNPEAVSKRYRLTAEASLKQKNEDVFLSLIHIYKSESEAVGSGAVEWASEYVK